MKEVTIVINENGWFESLKIGDKEYTKRYVRTKNGSEGLDISWEDDENAPEIACELFDELHIGLSQTMFTLYGLDHSDDAHDEDFE